MKLTASRIQIGLTVAGMVVLIMVVAAIGLIARTKASRSLKARADATLSQKANADAKAGRAAETPNQTPGADSSPTRAAQSALASVKAGANSAAINSVISTGKPMHHGVSARTVKDAFKKPHFARLDQDRFKTSLAK